MALVELSPGEIATVVEPPQAKPWAENLNIRIICPDCREDPPNLIEEFSSGDLICESCGMVLQQNVVDTRSEWRSFQNDDQGNDDPSRVGEAANPLLNGSQLSSDIMFTHGDIRSRELNRAQNRANEDRGNRTLLEAYKQIGNFCDAIHLSNVVTNMAKQLYKMTIEAKQFKGKNTEAIIAGCIFIACRQHGVGRTFKEISRLTRVQKKELGRVFKELEKFFKQSKLSALKSDANTANANAVTGYRNTNSTEPKELCGRFGSNLGLPTTVQIIAGECAESLLEGGMLAGRSPLSVAAVALYIISNLMGHPKSAREIGNACSVSDGTIRTAWRKIYDDRLAIVKPAWIEKGGNVDNLPPQ